MVQEFDAIRDPLHMLPNIVDGLAITQKDTVSSMQALGASYFEFRPAYLIPLFKYISGLEDKLYFQHACIPGLIFSWSKLSHFSRPIPQRSSPFTYAGMESLGSADNLLHRSSVLPCPRPLPNPAASFTAALQAA